MPDSKLIDIQLPTDFLFGVATAAYQIEGAAHEDGRGPSIWDAFSHTKGKVVNGDTGDVACEHYHRWQSDLDLIKQLQVQAYRFSFSWPRIIPNGSGAVNPKGLDFYDRLIDGCLQRELEPCATLYHWDLPLALQDKGGWTNRDTAMIFADYAELIARKFGDRLSSIATFNEPWCSAILGHLEGVHAPGICNMPQTVKVIHHQHLAHGLAIPRLREQSPSVPLGIVLNLQSIYAGSEDEVDQQAAIRHREFNNSVFVDPLFCAKYPTGFLDALSEHLPAHWEDDLPQINQPLDFWGLNYYTPARITHDPSPEAGYPSSQQTDPMANHTITDIGWEVCASSLGDLLEDLYEQYKLPPCYITENGACYNDEPDENGVVLDTRRIEYHQQHLQVIAEACKKELPVIGYFAWSFMDNFEWAEGYTMRFGLVHVDYETQQRTIKQSGEWYANTIAQHSTGSQS